VSVGTGLQWNPNSNDVERGHAVLHFVNQPDEIINLGYMYRKNTFIENLLDSNNIPQNDPLRSSVRSDDIIQSDISFRWPIYDNWYALGRWQYSLLYNTTQEGFFGVEKENCCWRFRIIGRHWINNINTVTGFVGDRRVVEGDSQNGVFFQIELKGLTGIGEKLDTFFEQNLYGYRKPQND
jgi:LPS-assembly protein